MVADPYPVFRQLHEEDPVHRSDVLGDVMLTRYADVQSVSQRSRLSSDHIAPFVRHRREREHAAEIQRLGRILRLCGLH